MNFILLQDIDNDEEWNILLEQTEQFKLSSNSCDIESIMMSHNIPRRITSALDESFKHVSDGLMEGGSTLRMLFRIIHNCIESKANLDVKFMFLENVGLLTNHSSYIYLMFNNKDVSEAWFASCIMDILEILGLIINLLKSNAYKSKIIIPVAKCFKSLKPCFYYQYDKQHKIKSAYLRCLSNLLDHSNEDRPVLFQPFIESSLLVQLITYGKLIQKLSPLLCLIYDIINKSISGSHEMKANLNKLLEEEPQDWFLRALFKDLHQKKNLNFVLPILVSVCDVAVLAKEVSGQCSSMSSLLSSTKNNELKDLMYQLCLKVIAHNKDESKR